MESGILKQWDNDRRFGIIYCSGNRRFFLHVTNVVAGTPALFHRVTFDVGPARHPTELAPALNAVIGEEIPPVRR